LIFIEVEVAIIIASLSESNKFGEDSPVSLPTVSKVSKGKIVCVGAYVGVLYLVGIFILIGFNVGDKVGLFDVGKYVGLFDVGKYVGDNVGIFDVGKYVGIFDVGKYVGDNDQDIIFEYVDFDD
jgi:hypothetical protein